MNDVILKRFDNPDDVRVFEKGRFETVRIGGMTIDRAGCNPGWKWSSHRGRPARSGDEHQDPAGGWPVLRCAGAKTFPKHPDERVWVGFGS